LFRPIVIVRAELEREGLQMVNLISPGTAHVQDPTTWAEQMRRIAPYAEQGLDPAPRHLRFVTWTLKYARCHWIELLGLKAHYQRAEIEATITADGVIRIKEPINITRFAILPPMLWNPNTRLTIGGQEVRFPPHTPGDKSGDLVLERRGEKWVAIGHRKTIKRTGKQPGLQGPIDDAFTTPFLCVRGTGKPWNPQVQAWADANLRRFAYEWSRYFRGELPIKDDTAVTPEDCRRCNLILFGDPGSNLWIRKALPSLPLRWTHDTCQLGKNQDHSVLALHPTTACLSRLEDACFFLPGTFSNRKLGERYLAADHAPALICPSPFPGKGSAPRYLVLNSGHTFHEAELNRLNYLLFPRLGDWAVFKIGATQPQNPSDPLQEEVIQAGYWNEQWK
jgi:hypothetical protein